MRRLLIGLIFVMSQGCVTLPQTADEFRAHFQRGTPFGAQVATYHTKKSFPSVVKTLEDRVSKCLNFAWRETKMVGGQLHSFGEEFTSRTQRLGPNHAEITVQSKEGVGPKRPPDGIFVMVVDVVKNPEGGTTLQVYGRKREERFFQALESWRREGIFPARR